MNITSLDDNNPKLELIVVRMVMKQTRKKYIQIKYKFNSRKCYASSHFYI